MSEKKLIIEKVNNNTLEYVIKFNCVVENKKDIIIIKSLEGSNFVSLTVRDINYGTNITINETGSHEITELKNGDNYITFR